MQNLMLPPLWALAKTFGIRPYYQRWDSRTAGAADILTPGRRPVGA